ncbi:MAG: hypothetical protein JWN30_1595, partial [Bacilli bacterium]|nr:hypothetical protein [Bacilli bacterium]
MSFTVAKVLAQALELEKLAAAERISLEDFRLHNGDGQWETRTLPIIWGGKDQVWYFTKELEIPESWTQQSVQLYFDLGSPRDRTACEGLLYLNGKRFFGLDTRHKSCDVPAEILQAGHVKIDLEVFAGLGSHDYRFERAELVRVHPSVLDLSLWLKTLAGSVATLSDQDPAKYRLLDLLGTVYAQVDMFSPKSDLFITSVQAALDLLHEFLAQLPPDPYVPQVTALGHSHIDLAYLWRVEHTRRKSIHTFSTVLTLMNKHPEFTYLQSQPQLYEYLEADAPELFAEIGQRVQEGRWEAEGGMWVESDCNIPAGESLVRQFLYGISYFKTKFNRESRILWLPDVFGYSSALPQILQLCNIPYFMTTKISWNDQNRLPYDTFRWKGLDGSEVLTHFITTPEQADLRYTYNGILDPQHSAGLWRNYQQKDINSELLLAFGYGDGGGGPTNEMIEAGKRINQIPRMPDIQFGTARNYFEQLERRVANNRALPVWDGELYLEYHRGTYTSQAKNKKFNRSSELLYREAELWNALSEAGPCPDQAALHEGWKLILKNQFHDIIPGTGIASVFQDSDKDYEQITRTGHAALGHALERITADVHPQESSLAVFNSLPWPRTDCIEWEGQQYVIDCIPACGYKLIAVNELRNRNSRTPSTTAWKITTDEMENAYFRIQFAACGQIQSILDKRADREVLSPGEHGNVLEVFEDRPLKYDNWNIDEDFSLKSAEITELLDAQVVQDDGRTGAVQFKLRWRDSVIVQKVIVYRHRAVIDFDTQVDWQERQTLLKVAFPVDVRSSF